jgi:hypothetical protein
MQYSDSDIQVMKLPLDGQKYRMNSDRSLAGNEERDEEACEKARKLGLYWQNLAVKDVGGLRYYPQNARPAIWGTQRLCANWAGLNASLVQG